VNKSQLKLTVQYHSAAQFASGEQKRLELTVFVQPRSEKFTLTLFVRPRSELFCNWRTKATQIAVFVLSRSEKLWNYRKTVVFVRPCSEKFQLVNKSDSYVVNFPWVPPDP
jgi:hypothetical protein